MCVKVFNLSSVEISEGEIDLLSLGTKFVPFTKTSPTEQKIDVLKFSRKIILKALFHNKPNTDSSLIKPKSNFVPKIAKNEVLKSVIEELEILANDFPAEVNYENVKDNLTLEQRKSFEMFKKRKNLVYFKADKGSGIVLMDPKFYRDKVLQILNSDKYSKLSKNVSSFIQFGLKRLVKKYEMELTDNERRAVLNFDPNVANIYALPKIHKSEAIKKNISSCQKSHLHLSNPKDLPFRLIFGACNNETVGLQEFLNCILEPFIYKVNSRVRDVHDFINKMPVFKQEDLPYIELISVDVKSMYENLEENLGIPALRFFLSQYSNLLPPRISENFVVEAMIFILNNNIGYFNGEFYKQLSGTATGIKPAPKYADLAMGYLEIQLYFVLKNKLGTKVALYFWDQYRRYLDDGMIFWDKRLCPFEEVFEIMNSQCPSVKYTMERDEDRLVYLDIEIYRTKDGFKTMVYSKPTDSGNYLPYRSNHPRHCRVNIPFNLARRVRMLTDDNNLCEEKLSELSARLKNSEYPLGLVNNAVSRALALSSAELRNYTPVSAEDEVIAFVHTFDPAYTPLMSRIKDITSRLKISKECKDIFGNIRFIESCREPKSLLGYFQHSKFDEIKPSVQFGVKKCGKKNCKLCKELLVGQTILFEELGLKIVAKGEMDCTSKNVIYALFCGGCDKYYIGQTKNLRSRMSTHRYNSKHSDHFVMEVSRHLYNCGRGFKVFPLQKIKEDCIYTRLVEEDAYIKLLKPNLNADKRNLLHLQK